jgi:beta-glucosidase
VRSEDDIPVESVVIINKERSEGVKKRDQATTAIRAKRRKLTLKQRCSLLSGQSKWSSQGIPEQGIDPFVMSDGPHGLRREKEDGSSFPATCFPPEVTLSCSWDPEMVYQVAAAIAEEAAAQGVDVILGPGLNIKRSPLCGRNFEYFSEDPLLSGTLGRAYIEGAKSRCVETCVKHFFANNQESNRMTIDVRLSERAAREIYIRPFEIAIRGADPGMVMAAYNQINGTYATEHRHALTTLLRDQWHYRGVTVSDWSAVQNRESSVRAGLDLEMPDSDGVNDEKVYRAVRRLALPEGCVNRSVERQIAFGERCEENRQARRELTFSSTDAHHQLARRAAAESIVLLENKHQLLPLAPEKLPRDHRLLVVGALAKTPRLQGGGSSQVNANWIETPWDSLKAVYADVQLDYADGYALTEVSENEQQALSARP